MPVSMWPGASHIWPSKEYVEGESSKGIGFSSTKRPDKVADMMGKE